MNKRQAKKIMRLHPYGRPFWVGVRGGTWDAAFVLMQRTAWRYRNGRYTKGWRLGRWDPKFPSEFPF